MYRSVIVVEEFMTMLACWSNAALYPNTHISLSSVLYLTLVRNSTIWPQASRITPSRTSCRPLILAASPSTNLKHLSPGCPTWLPPLISPLMLQIPTLHPIWPLAPVETPQGWWPTPQGATASSSPRTQGKSCCSQLVIMVSWDENVCCFKNQPW